MDNLYGKKKSGRSPFKHDCTLSGDYLEQNIDSPFESSKTLNIIRRELFSIHRCFEGSKYFRTLASMMREKNRHLSNSKFKYVIHPFSRFVLIKDVIVCVVWFTSCTLESYAGSFMAKNLYGKEDYPVVIYNTLMTMNLILLFDIVIRFNIGRPIEKTQQVSLERKTIAKMYIMTYFFVDSIPVVGFFLIFTLPGLGSKTELVLFQLHKIRLVRMKTLLEKLSEFLKKNKFSEIQQLCVTCLMAVFITVHQWTCLIEYVNHSRGEYDVNSNKSWLSFYTKYTRLQDVRQHRQATSAVAELEEEMDETLRSYLLQLGLVVSHFCGVGTFLYTVESATEMFILSLVLMTGLVFTICILARLLQIFMIVTASEARYDELTVQVEDYMKNKNFSRLLKKRVLSYYDYKYGKKFFSERQILGTLTEHLRMEVLLYSCQNLVEEVRLFRGLSKPAVGCILALLKQEIYTNGDIIMNSESKSGSIYFILYGTCGVILPTGEELTHVEDGRQFGDMNKLTQYDLLQFPYTVMALETTEIYELQLKDMMYACRTFPELSFKLEAMANTTAKAYNKLFTLRGEEDAVTDEILTQLRHGKILRPGLKRAELESTTDL